jgi:hypothetical protein
MVQPLSLESLLTLILTIVIIFPRLFAGKDKGFWDFLQYLFKGLVKFLELFFSALFELLKGVLKLLEVLITKIFDLLSALIRWIYKQF